MQPLERLENMEFSAVVAAVKEFDSAPPAGAVPFRIAFLRNITIDPMTPYLKYECFRAGLKPEIYMGDFDVVMPETMNPDSPLYAHKPDLVSVVLTLDLLAEPLVSDFAGRTSKQAEEAASTAANFVEGVLGNLRRHTSAPILVHSFATPPFPAFGILDAQDSGRQTGTLRRLNDRLAELAAGAGNCFLVDIDLIAARLGHDRFADPRLWHIGKIPYTRDAWKAIAAEYGRFIRALRGKNKKCLVLDCDNTLWGGVIGEDGLDKIKIGRAFPGSCYRAFQQEALNLYHRGVILAICSKNNEDDVLDALDRHPEMALRREHFASMRINWINKPDNIREIAEELNIGTDSIVFVDDSEMEIGMVRNMMPEVETILLPKEPSRYAGALAGCGLFDTLTHSEEDMKRGRMYREEADRKRSRVKFDNVDDYLRSLEMEVAVSKADEFSLPRIAQLMQRTNQFNLTTRRHTEGDVAAFAASDDFDVLFLHYRDRYGEMGIVGAAVLKHGAGGGTEIDSFLISCRALGRRVEDLFLFECIQTCRARGRKAVTGIYIPTAKNTQTAGFYEKCGFMKVREENGTVAFRLDLTGADTPDPRGLFKSVKSDS